MLAAIGAAKSAVGELLRGRRATAKSGETGGSGEGAVSVGKGMEIYQFTESGLALQATIQGTKYWKNEDLN